MKAAEEYSVLGGDLPLNMPSNAFDELTPLKANLPALYRAPTPLQRYALPLGLAGRDLVMIGAPRGSGQAASLLLPLVNALAEDRRPPTATGERSTCRPQALLLAPTRSSLATLARVAELLVQGTGVSLAVANGNVPIEDTLKQLPGARLLLSTPGRLLDLIERGSVAVDGVQLLSLAATDVLLDHGYEFHIRRLLAEEGMPQERQTLVSSSRLDPPLKALLPLLTKPNCVHLSCTAPWRPPAHTEFVLQQVCYSAEDEKQGALGKLLSRHDAGLSLVVTSTRRVVDMMSYCLKGEGVLHVALTGEKVKSKERDASLQAFVNGASPVLVTTEAVLRSLSLPNVSHVINYDLPSTFQDYIDRLTLTGRHGHSGRLTTIITDSSHGEFVTHLIDFLRTSDSDVPRWLEGMTLQRASAPPL